MKLNTGLLSLGICSFCVAMSACDLGDSLMPQDEFEMTRAYYDPAEIAIVINFDTKGQDLSGMYTDFDPVRNTINGELSWESILSVPTKTIRDTASNGTDTVTLYLYSPISSVTDPGLRVTVEPPDWTSGWFYIHSKDFFDPPYRKVRITPSQIEIVY